MNTREINAILGKECASFLGTFPANHIPVGRGWSVINLDESDKPGSHWTVVGPCEFFDSYGISPLSHYILTHLKKRCKKKWWYNNISLQSYNSKVCGHYCIYYILLRCKGVTPDAIIKTLTNSSQPDRLVYTFVQQLK
jgi:hypothetical protein